MLSVLSTILSGCVVDQQQKPNRFLNDHLLVCILSGDVQFQAAQCTYRYRAGQVILVRRNQVVRNVKLTTATGELSRVITLWLRQEDLRHYITGQALGSPQAYHGDTIVEIAPNPLVTGYFGSLVPYLDIDGQLTGPLVTLKTKEAIELLMHCQPTLRQFLFDFHQPYKIDLESYMIQHYTVNVPLSQFAWMTGRSLATFKRDFKKTFATSPQKWLTQHRLIEAHSLLAEGGQKPSDVYVDVGFENFSHFSFAFRQQFGYSPSQACEPLNTTSLSG